MLVAVGSDGRTYSTPVSQLPSARGDGLPISSFFDMEPGTSVVGYAAGSGSEQIVLATDNGFGLKCRLSDLFARVRSGKAFMKTDAGATLLEPQRITARTPYLACLSEQGRLLVFDLTELRELRGGGKGVILMDLNPGEKLAAAVTAGEAGCVVLGAGRTGVQRRKVISKNDWRQQFGHRARKGRELPIRFVPTILTAISEEAPGEDAAASEQDEDEPALF